MSDITDAEIQEALAKFTGPAPRPGSPDEELIARLHAASRPFALQGKFNLRLFGVTFGYLLGRLRERAVVAQAPVDAAPKLPRRRHVLSLKIQADSPEELSWALKELAIQALERGFAANGASGGVSSCWSYEYSEDRTVTAESYRSTLISFLERLRAEREGGS
ncbi:MAG: hypothetical protein GC161_18255 [Planctomycetaceae bacterium]|nr:hypothetical protein [Planctomycetaceae bacterium]